MAKSAKPAAKAEPAKAAPAEGEATAKPKSKIILLAVIGVLILGAAGGAGWYFMKGSKHADEPKPVVVEAPTFLSLEPFTVNLQHEESDQYLNVGITLKVASAEIAEKIRQSLPEVRSRLLFILSSKHATELVPLEGKKKLAREIIAEINNIIGPHATSTKAAEHEGAATPNAESSSGVEVTTPSGVEAAPPVAAASAPAGAEAHAAEANSGVIEVLYTAFIIQ